MTTTKILEMPPVEWETAINGLSNIELQRLERELEGLAEKAARLAAYVDQRHGNGCGDQGHRAAVRKQNMVARALRRAFGYSYPGHADFTF